MAGRPLRTASKKRKLGGAVAARKGLSGWLQPDQSVAQEVADETSIGESGGPTTALDLVLASTSSGVTPSPEPLLVAAARKKHKPPLRQEDEEDAQQQLVMVQNIKTISPVRQKSERIAAARAAMQQVEEEEDEGEEEQKTVESIDSEEDDSEFDDTKVRRRKKRNSSNNKRKTSGTSRKRNTKDNDKNKSKPNVKGAKNQPTIQSFWNVNASALSSQPEASEPMQCVEKASVDQKDAQEQHDETQKHDAVVHDGQIEQSICSDVKDDGEPEAEPSQSLPKPLPQENSQVVQTNEEGHDRRSDNDQQPRSAADCDAEDMNSEEKSLGREQVDERKEQVDEMNLVAESNSKNEVAVSTASDKRPKESSQVHTEACTSDQETVQQSVISVEKKPAPCRENNTAADSSESVVKTNDATEKDSKQCVADVHEQQHPEHDSVAVASTNTKEPIKVVNLVMSSGRPMRLSVLRSQQRQQKRPTNDHQQPPQRPQRLRQQPSRQAKAPNDDADDIIEFDDDSETATNDDDDEEAEEEEEEDEEEEEEDIEIVHPSKRKRQSRGCTSVKTETKHSQTKKKNDTSQQNPPTKKPPAKSNQSHDNNSRKEKKTSTNFFMSHEAKKIAQEVEAMASFREERRRLREKDLEFFQGKTLNPFFMPRTGSDKSPTKAKPKSSTGADCIDLRHDSDNDDEPVIIDVTQTNGSSVKWKESAVAEQASSKSLFPSFQHVLITDLESPSTSMQWQWKNDHSHLHFAGQVDAEMTLLEWRTLLQTRDSRLYTETARSERFWLQIFRQEVVVPIEQLPRQPQEQQPSSQLDSNKPASKPRPKETVNHLLRAPAWRAINWQNTVDEDDLVIDFIVEHFHLEEPRVREVFDSLLQARQGRLLRAENLSLVDLYLPVYSAGVIGNDEAVSLLHAWMDAWKQRDGVSSSSSGSCFENELLYAFEEDDEDDEEELQERLFKLFVLEGPLGSGKSCSVHACAQELGYEVIEIHASQTRSGKQIIELAGEATQSTRVLHQQSTESSTNKKQKHKNKQKAHKRRRLSGLLSGGTPPKATSRSHLSLVLFDDIQVAFDEDRGFLNTLASMAKSSKCPIVVTCDQLPDGFPPSKLPCLRREFRRPSHEEFCGFIWLVAFIEKLFISNAVIEAMAQLFKCDLRRALHFLECEAIEGVQSQECEPQVRWGLQCAAAHGGSAEHDDLAEGHNKPSSTGVTLLDVMCSPASSAPHQQIAPGCVYWKELGLDCCHSNLLDEFQAAWPQPDIEIDAEDEEGDEEEDDDDDANAEKSQAQSDKLNDRCRMLKQEQFDQLDSMQLVLDSVSMADTWRMAGIQDEEDAQESLAMELRVSACSFGPGRLTTQHKQKPNTESSCPFDTSRDKMLQRAQQQQARLQRRESLSMLHGQLALPVLATGSASCSARINLDYLPMIARLHENCEVACSGRRRVSRRYHYLKDVFADFAHLDDLMTFCNYTQQEPVREAQNTVAA